MNWKVVLRSVVTISGERSVASTGTTLMPELCADN